jgi:uncharacterized protein
VRTFRAFLAEPTRNFLDMNRLRLRVLCSAAWALLAACEKPTPFEITTPAMAGTNTPSPMFDASFPLLDANMRPSADAETTPETPVTEFTQAELLKAIGDCALGRYRAFVPLATTLRDATRAYADSLSPESLAGAQQAWRLAIERWQELELFRFGPAGSSAEPGGKDIRNNIYFYPDLDNCQVDFTTVNRAYQMGAQAASVSGRGLGALEYLLFNGGAQNSCSSSSSINMAVNGGLSSWQQIDANELTRRRADYAAVLAEDLLAQSNALVAGWEPAAGNFLTQFATAGAGSTLFARAYDAFNLIDNSMFYWDKELKDFKVAIPAGISDLCTAATCPASVESRFSGASNANMRGNISGFRLLFNGCGSNYSGLGFDDWLRSIGKADLADRMTNAIIAADRAVEALPFPLEQMLSANLPQVVALHAALKGVSDPLKTEFVGALNLELPAAAQGDND